MAAKYGYCTALQASVMPEKAVKSIKTLLEAYLYLDPQLQKAILEEKKRIAEIMVGT